MGFATLNQASNQSLHARFGSSLMANVFSGPAQCIDADLVPANGNRSVQGGTAVTNKNKRNNFVIIVDLNTLTRCGLLEFRFCLYYHGKTPKIHGDIHM